RIHTREEADCGPRPVLVGSETAPTEIAHTPGSVPEPTVRVTGGSVPSDSSAAGVGLWVAMSEETGTQPTQIAATKNAAGACQLAIMQWSGTGASASATNAANPSM